MNTSLKVLRLADRVGCSLSLACAVHCLAAPLFLTGFSVFAVAEELEMPMMLLALAMAAATFTDGFVRHATWMPMALLLAASPVMVASWCVRTPLWETSLLVSGALLLSVGHIVNLRAGHTCCQSSVA